MSEKQKYVYRATYDRAVGTGVDGRPLYYADYDDTTKKGAEAQAKSDHPDAKLMQVRKLRPVTENEGPSSLRNILRF